MVMRPCIDCHVLTRGRTRCAPCAAQRERERRPNAAARGYDAAYRAERKALLADSPRCTLALPGCTYWATTADHVVPVRMGGAGGPLRPACAHCNSARR